jgi:hypothetical protein
MKNSTYDQVRKQGVSNLKSIRSIANSVKSGTNGVVIDLEKRAELVNG